MRASLIEGLAEHACAAVQIIPRADRKPASKSCCCEPMIWVLAPTCCLWSHRPCFRAACLQDRRALPNIPRFSLSAALLGYPHWMMAGFIGLAFHRNRNGPESTPTERLKAMRESASAPTNRAGHGNRLASSGRRRGNDPAGVSAGPILAVSPRALWRLRSKRLSAVERELKWVR
jgi:hypothetical protein